MTQRRKLTLEFDVGNAAFDGEDLYPAAADVLQGVADVIRRDLKDHGLLFDVNGNRIGQWHLDALEESDP